MGKNIKDEFDAYFKMYQREKFKNEISYKITSTDRPKDPQGSPHRIPGNALDFSLRKNGDFAGIHEYNYLFAWLLDRWPYRAGIDNTTGNIHIHLDLGETKVTVMPYFFKEDDGKFKYQIKSKEQIA